jgi:hypothetical protein
MLRLDLDMIDFIQARRLKIQKKMLKTIKRQKVRVGKSPLLQKQELSLMIDKSEFWNKLSKKDSTLKKTLNMH